MPRYDYDCADCGTRFEVVHGVHADPPASCPTCGSAFIKKAFAPPTIHFKGSGWAKKERRSGAGSSGAKARGSEGSATPSSEGPAAEASSSSAGEDGGTDRAAATGTPAAASARSAAESSSGSASD